MNDNDWAEFAEWDDSNEFRDKADLLSRAWHEGWNDCDEGRESAYKLICVMDADYAAEYENGWFAACDDRVAREDRIESDPRD